jgi:hypothetical protein
MPCDQFKEILSEYIDGSLTGQRKTQLEDHLSVCDRCREELASLKALVSELGSLEPVKAPPDFLDQLHNRIESRFTLSRLVRMLFVPVPVKIPLEVATVAALVILIFVGLTPPQREGQIVPMPESSKPVMVAKKAMVDHEEPIPTERAPERRRPLEEAPTALPEGRKETVGLASRPAPEVSDSASATGEAMQPAWTHEKVGRAVEKKKGQMDVSAGQKVTGLLPPVAGELRPEGVPLPMETGELERGGPAIASLEEEKAVSKEEARGTFRSWEEIISRVKDLLRPLEGRLISVAYEKDATHPESIDVEIPAKNYALFRKELDRLTVFRALPPIPPGREQQMIQLRLRFITSN